MAALNKSNGECVANAGIFQIIKVTSASGECYCVGDSEGEEYTYEHFRVLVPEVPTYKLASRIANALLLVDAEAQVKSFSEGMKAAV